MPRQSGFSGGVALLSWLHFLCRKTFQQSNWLQFFCFPISFIAAQMYRSRIIGTALQSCLLFPVFMYPVLQHKCTDSPENSGGVKVIMAVCIYTAEKRFSSVYVAVCFLLSCVLFSCFLVLYDSSGINSPVNTASCFLSPVSCLLFPVYTGFNRIVAGYSFNLETQALRLYRNLH